MANELSPKDVGSPENRPVDLFSAMRSEMDRVFDRFHHGWPSLPQIFQTSDAAPVVPGLDLTDNGKSIVVEAELPGVDEKDVEVTVKGGVLSIKGEKRREKEEKAANHYLMERSYGQFSRSIQLPDSVDQDQIVANFDKGVLTITAPRRPGAVTTEKKIEISAA